MTSKRPFTSAIIVFAALALFVCVWLLFIAPVFQEKEKMVRSENAALAKDIAEIEAMDGNLGELERKFAETGISMENKYASRTDTVREAASRIEGICAGLGYRTSKIAVGQEQLLYPAGSYAPALYSVDITFLIEDSEDAGAAVIRGLENCKTADFEVTGFVYRSTPVKENDEDEDSEAAEDIEIVYHNEWIFAVTLYYYD